MFESRCGICCNSCGRKAQVGCKGCLSMAQPFWGGECPVKSCCENKALDHCGQCQAFPCQVLTNMGKEEGFDPSGKIEQCRRWALEDMEDTAEAEEASFK